MQESQSTDTRFQAVMLTVAREIWGEANSRLSRGAEFRWGAHGSRSVDVAKGTWYDHEANVGGGVLDFLIRERRVDKAGALEYLSARGLIDPQAAAARIVATYDYRDESGTLLFQVCRFEPKDFRQRRPDAAGGWNWSTKGVRRVLYRLSETLEAVAGARTIYVCEGEKAVLALVARGLDATCSPGGAGKWQDEYSPVLMGADVVLLADNDDAGRGHVTKVAASLAGTAANVVSVPFMPGVAEKGDAFDYFANGGTPEELVAHIETCRATPPPESEASEPALADALPELIVQGGNLPATARELGVLLARAGTLYDRGGVVVRLVPALDGGLPVAHRLSANAVVVEAHQHCQPVREKDGTRVPVTLPERVAAMYLEAREWNLPRLASITGAPILADDGAIVSGDGYAETLGIWCKPVPALHVPEQPSRVDAETALLALRRRFASFPFRNAAMVRVDAVDMVDLNRSPGEAESCFLAALLTGVCRPSLPTAPGLLISAPAVSGAGSGKGLLVRAICAVAFGLQPAAFTAGHDRQELDKRLVAELIEAGPVLFLDNVNATALRSDTLASVLTENPARVRVMGVSQMVPLNCSAFIAVTGNGLSVSEDLARRFVAVELDPQCDDPEARPFAPGFLAGLLADRGAMLSAALTIWRWGRQDRQVPGMALGSFEQWAAWCRDPLLALGCADPVQRIRDAKAADPRRRFVAELFEAWNAHHGTRPVKGADLVEPLLVLIDPQKRGRQHVAARLHQMIGTRAAGFVLTQQRPAGRWGASSYALVSTSPVSPENHRDHRGHRGEPQAFQGLTAQADPPMPPLCPPMPPLCPPMPPLCHFAHRGVPEPQLSEQDQALMSIVSETTPVPPMRGEVPGADLAGGWTGEL